MILTFACILLSINAFAAQVKGVVVDQAGQPVTGAFVLQKGTSNGTVTDIDGQFAIDVPSDAILEVSCLGYNTQEVAVEGKSFLNVVLAEDTQLLEEVMVLLRRRTLPEQFRWFLQTRFQIVRVQTLDRFFREPFLV